MSEQNNHVYMFVQQLDEASDVLHLLSIIECLILLAGLMHLSHQARRGSSEETVMTNLQEPRNKTVRADSAGDHLARPCAGRAPDDTHAAGAGDTCGGQPWQRTFGLRGELQKYSTIAKPYVRLSWCSNDCFLLVLGSCRQPGTCVDPLIWLEARAAWF